jgi:hypothetical protein
MRIFKRSFRCAVQIILASIICAFSTLILQAQESKTPQLSREENIYLLERELDLEAIAESCPPGLLMGQLNELHVPQLLEKNFYCHTNPLNIQSLLDTGFVLNDTGFLLMAPYKQGFTTRLDVRPFYNQTSKMYFTKYSPYISSYLNFANADFLDIIESSEAAESLIGDISVVELFKQIKMQQRRLGFMFNGATLCGRWQFLLHAPFYYNELNFFLTDQEIQAIQEAPLFENPTNGSDEDDTTAFLTKHLASDAVGLGDSRLEAWYITYENEKHALWLGAHITLPTAWALRRGIIGGVTQSDYTTTFSLEEMMALNLCTPLDDETSKNEASRMAVNFGIGALDILSANLAETSLGNGGHVGLAPKITYEYHPAPWIGWYNTAHVEYLAPCNEERFFIVHKDKAAFAAHDFEDESKDQENLAFLNQQAINTLYPNLLLTKVTPGPICYYATQLHLDGTWGSLYVGYDFWWQGQEHIKLACRPTQVYDIGRGIKSSAWKHTLFSGIDCPLPYLFDSARIGFDNSFSFATQGIGKDYTLALHVDFMF